LELIIDINKDHPDFICKEQGIVFGDEDIELEDQIEKKNLKSMVGLDDDLVKLIIENRTEGPLTTDSIKYGYPSMLRVADEDMKSSN